MGFYDCRCMVTGISLRATEATLVVLRRAGDTYQPITLGITGKYDRLGAIDFVNEDTNTDLVLTYFLDRLRDGRAVLRDGNVVVDPEELQQGKDLKTGADWQVADIENLLWFFERNNLWFLDEEYPPAATLDGALVVFALIAQPVWDTLAATVSPSQGLVDVLFEQLFGDFPVAGEIYRGRLTEVSEQIRQLYVVSDFLAARGLVWAPPAEPSQRYPTEVGAQYGIGEFLDEAKRDYREVVAMRAAFDEYERQIGPWLDED